MEYADYPAAWITQCEFTATAGNAAHFYIVSDTPRVSVDGAIVSAGVATTIRTHLTSTIAAATRQVTLRNRGDAVTSVPLPTGKTYVIEASEAPFAAVVRVGSFAVGAASPLYLDQFTTRLGAPNAGLRATYVIENVTLAGSLFVCAWGREWTE